MHGRLHWQALTTGKPKSPLFMSERYIWSRKCWNRLLQDYPWSSDRNFRPAFFIMFIIIIVISEYVHWGLLKIWDRYRKCDMKRLQDKNHSCSKIGCYKQTQLWLERLRGVHEKSCLWRSTASASPHRTMCVAWRLPETAQHFLIL